MTDRRAQAPLTADASLIITQLRSEVARIGWTETARRAGVDRANLHRQLRRSADDRNGPRLATIVRVADAVGLQLLVKVRGQA